MRSLIIFSIYLILPTALRPEVDPISNRNEYRKIFLRVKRGRRVRLVTSLPCVSRLSKKYGTFDVSQRYGHPLPDKGTDHFYFYRNKFPISDSVVVKALC
jgi:hypothetical protein